MPSTPLAALSLTHNEQEIFQWIADLTKRFPKWVDARLIKGFYYLLGPGVSPAFIKERSLHHLKRLLVTQFLLQKKIEDSFALKKEPFLIRTFPIHSLICIAIAAPKTNPCLTDQTILEVASQKIPTLKKIDTSFYQWTNKKKSYEFFYLELEKMRGKKLFTPEVQELKNYLKTELCHYLSEASVFWPYNHEETFKQLLILAKEISSSSDYPQVSIHFQKQTTSHLEFLVYLARPKVGASSELAITNKDFPTSIQFATHLTQEIDAEIPTLIEAFSLVLPSEKYKKGAAVNLLFAREFIAKVLENILGTIRDYNGGLFETQKHRFRELSKKFSSQLPNFSLFGESLFYALCPVEKQICLEETLFNNLFEGFSQILNKKESFLNKPNQYTLILRSQTSKELTAYLERAKDLHKKERITAYAKLNILSQHFLCLVDETGKGLDKILFNPNTPKTFTQTQPTLRLTLQCGEVPSLCPYYLAKEMRGRSIAQFLFEGLVRLTPKKELEWAGCLEFTLSRNKKRYLFKLRPSYWSNGEKVTALHYEKTWKRNFLIKNQLNLFYNLKNADSIKRKKNPIEELGVQAIDENILQVELEKQDPYFTKKLTNPLFFPCYSDHYEPSVFNGAFYVERKSDQALLLERNPYYWNKKNILFNKIDMQFEFSSLKIYQQFQNNQTDWIGPPFNYDLSLFANKKELLYPFFIHLNTKYFPLSSPLIRRALSCVIDRDLVVKDIFPGCRPFSGILPTQLSLLKAGCSGSQILEGRRLFEKGLKSLGLTRQTFPPLKLSSCHLAKHRKLAAYLKRCWESIFKIQVDVNIKEYAMCEFSEVGDGLKKGHADRHTVCVKINMKRGNKPLQLEQILS